MPRYFDHAATTPLDPQVFAAMTPYLRDEFYNPSALYAPARTVRNALEEARHDVAKVLGAKPAEITFTSGGTEGNNLLIQGVLNAHPAGNIVVSSIEHDSVLAPARNYNYRLCDVSSDGLVVLKSLRETIDENTVLVSIMYANNEVGSIQPIREISQLLQSIKAERKKSGNRKPLYFHTDACQAANYLDLHVARLGVDAMTLNGSKIYGPKGSGILYVKAGVELKPLLVGGGQESGLRSGTENVPGCIGFAQALVMARELRETESRRLTELRELFISKLAAGAPQCSVNGSRKHRLANNIHITIPGKDAETLIIQLEGKAMLCAAGSACSASSQEPSHVLMAMGLGESDARSSLRITLGRSTDEQAVIDLVNAIATLAA